MKSITFYFKVMLGLPKSLYINLHYFGLSGMRLPILVVWRTHLSSVNGEIIIKKPIRFGLVKYGFLGVAMSSFHEWNVWNVNGTITFEGSANFGTGSRLFVGHNGKLNIGDNFLLTATGEICCNKEVSIGRDVLFSWDILLMDTDSHPFRDEKNEIMNPDKSIQIGKNVWIGCRTIMLKGAYIADNSIVGAGTVVYKKFLFDSVIIAGNPADVVKNNIRWLREDF
jgi:acetyltransferase-like isoleucine patch superfamily enzyme